MDDGKIISMRMEARDIQSMDEFLEKHREIGGRSVFIRNAIREYIDRDADVSHPIEKNEVAVKLAAAELDTIDSMIADGIYIDRSDAIRTMVRDKVSDREAIAEMAHSKYSAAASSMSR